MSDYDSKNQKHKAQPVIACFSMEVGINPSLPTYSGGLGILAGDSLRAAADLGVHIHYLNCSGIRSDIFADATPMAESAAP
jgi:glucan phosphorylase